MKGILNATPHTTPANNARGQAPANSTRGQAPANSTRGQAPANSTRGQACRRDAAVYFLLAHTGLRLSELIDLKRGDLDLTGGRLRVEDAKGRHDASCICRRRACRRWRAQCRKQTPVVSGYAGTEAT